MTGVCCIRPLLGVVHRRLNVSRFQAGLVTVIARVNCTTKLLFVAPLNSLCRHGGVVLTGFLILVFSLLAVTLTRGVRIVLITSFLAKTYSVVPRVFVPVTTRFSHPRRGNEGMKVILSKLLANVLTSHIIDKLINRLFK